MAEQTVVLGWEREESEKDALVRRNRDHIFLIAVKVTGRRDLAEDITQDVCLRLVKNARKIAPDDVDAWVRRTTVRRCLSALGKRGHDQEIESAHAGDPTQDIAVRQTLARLRPEARTLLGLALGLGYSYEEIAEALQIPVGTVASRLHTAKQAFRDAWEEKR